MIRIKTLAMALVAMVTMGTSCSTAKNQTTANVANRNNAVAANDNKVIVGAARTNLYVKQLKGKRVALLSNQTGMVGDKHTLDIMLENGINVTTIFSPEHGFRGNADAGEKVSSSVDEKTGIPIASLYGDGKQMEKNMERFDVIVIDLQDVGLRFYTYYVTMINMMDAAIEYGKEFVVLDRPNPNIMYVDGPILDMSLKSGVGRLPIPTVYGITMGELAKMAMGEGWLKDGKTLPLTVVPCDNYTRHTRYALPIAPSPNLPNMLSVYLYPSTCYFEGTPVSLGRGTDWPFQVYGHPDMKNHKFSFTPKSRFGAKTPPCQDQLCYGTDLHNLTADEVIKGQINLQYVIDAYNSTNLGDKFFTRFFDLLMGRKDIKQMIMDGKSADEIKATWADDVAKFKVQRKPYLLYKD